MSIQNVLRGISVNRTFDAWWCDAFPIVDCVCDAKPSKLLRSGPCRCRIQLVLRDYMPGPINFGPRGQHGSSKQTTLLRHHWRYESCAIRPCPLYQPSLLLTCYLTTLLAHLYSSDL